MKIEFDTNVDNPALLMHIAKFFEVIEVKTDRRVTPTKPAPIDAPVAAPLPELTIPSDDLPDAGAISTLAEISQLGFGEDTPPPVNPATVGFGNVHAQPEPISTGGVAVDKSNCPHDARIHSSPPKINADGMWRKRKNVEQAEFDLISNQLRGIMSVNPAPVAPIAPPPPVMQAPIAPPPPVMQPPIAPPR